MDTHHRKYNTSTGLENFILRLKENNPDLEYYSDYIDSENKVKLKCNKCGNIFERYASCVRQNKKVRCYECEKFETANKKIKEKQLKAKEKQKKVIDKLLQSEQLGFSICEQCGSLITGNKKFCNDKCNKRHYYSKNEIKRRTNIKKNGNVDYTISLEKLIKRDSNICYLCNKECNLEDYTYQGNTFIAGNYYPSIEHIIPLSKGGTHSWNNIKLAHRICNTLKGSKILE